MLVSCWVWDSCKKLNLTLWKMLCVVIRPSWNN